MARTLWRRLRAAISFLADLGRAATTLGVAAGLVAAAVALALDVFSGVEMVLFAAGVGLASFWAVGYFLGPRLRPIERAAPAVTVPNPWAAASRLEETGRLQALRRAARQIREELLDNQQIVEEALEQSTFSSFNLQTDAWDKQNKALLDHDDPVPYRVSREAYRRLGVIPDSERTDVDLSNEQIIAIDAARDALEEATTRLARME